MANRNTNKIAESIYKETNKKVKTTEQRINEKIAQKLRETIITNIMASFGPVTEHGKEVKSINDYQRRVEKKEKEQSKDGSYTKHHRQKLPYHRSGTLLEAIHVEIIDGEVQLIVDKLPYEDETGQRKTERTALDVYWYLNNGVKGSDTKVYPFKVVTTKDGKTRYLFTHPPTIEGRDFHKQTYQTVAEYQKELLEQEGLFHKR